MSTPDEVRPLRVFVDADVLFAGAASRSEHSASYLVLVLGELGLLDAVTAEQAVEEGARNLQENLDAERATRALERFRRLVARGLRVVPTATLAEEMTHVGKADAKDLPLLVTALREGCTLLVTFNGRDYRPGDPAVEVLDPGTFIRRLRGLLTRMAGA